MISIIGAGPAGSYTAYLLAKNNFDVNVYEEHEKIGSPIQCSGVITPALDSLLKIKKSIVVNKIKKFRFYSPNGKFFETDIKHDYVFDRGELDRYIASLAEKEGARFITKRFLSFEKENDQIKMKFNDGFIKTDKLIGADGPYSSVAKAAGLFGERKFIAGVQARAKIKEHDKDVTDIYLGYGEFGWLIPEDEYTARIGIVAEKNPNESFNALMKRCQAKFICHQSGMIPLYNSKIKTQKDNVYLVGDAATMVKATSVDYEEPVIIFEEGLIKNVKIGEYVNKLMDKDKANVIIEDEKLQLKYLNIKDNTKVFTVDKKANLQNPILNKVIKHKILDNLYELICEKGYRIKVTETHSVMILADKGIVDKRTSDLIENKDYLLVSSSVPKNDSIKEINIIKLILKYDRSLIDKILVFGGKKYLKSIKNINGLYMKNLPKTYFDRDLIPLQAFLDQGVIPENVKIVRNPAKKFLAIPNKIRITEEFARLLGYYVAEGYDKGTNIILSLGMEDERNGNIEDIIKCIRKVFAIRFSLIKDKNRFTNEDSRINLCFGGSILCLLFSRLLKCGSGAKNKEIPYIIYNIEDKLKLQFLKGYYRGDGHLRVRMGEKRKNWSSDLTVETASRKLSSDLILLLFQLRIIPTLKNTIHKGRKLYNQFIKTTVSYTIAISNKSDLYKIKDFFPEKKEKLLKFIELTEDSRSISGIPKILIKDIIEKHKNLFKKYYGLTYYSYKTYSYDKMLNLLSEIKDKTKKEELYYTLIKNKILILPIKKIRKVKPTKNEVFDLEVNEINTFVGGLGPILLHNTHGGILYSLLGAKCLSESIIRNKDYEKLWRSKIGLDLWLNLKIRNTLLKFNDKDYNKLVEYFSKERVKRVLSENVRDFPSKFILKLLVNEPRLLRYATKAI